MQPWRQHTQFGFEFESKSCRRNVRESICDIFELTVGSGVDLDPAARYFVNELKTVVMRKEFDISETVLLFIMIEIYNVEMYKLQ